MLLGVFGVNMVEREAVVHMDGDMEVVDQGWSHSLPLEPADGVRSLGSLTLLNVLDLHCPCGRINWFLVSLCSECLK